MKTYPLRCLACAAILAFSLTGPTHATSYTIIDLGTMGSGHDSYAYGLNESRMVVGDGGIDVWGTSHAFLYHNSMMHDLGTFGGNISYARDINYQGYVVGHSLVSTGGTRGYLYDGNTMHDIGSLSSPYGYSTATAINDNGEITGDTHVDTPNGRVIHAYYYDGSNMHDIGTLGGSGTPGTLISSARDINSSGNITGESLISGNTETHAFLYDGVTMHDIGTVWGGYSHGEAINDNGWVTGTSSTINGQHHAFLYDGNIMHDLGTLGGSWSDGLDINSSGHIVGRSGATNGSNYAFIFDGNTMHNLCTYVNCTSAGWDFLFDAWAINDNGDIVGSGSIGGETHAFLVTLGLPSPDGDVAPLGAPDGIINAGDLVAMYRFALGQAIPTALDLAHGDVYPPGNPNGVINLQDLLIVQQMLLP